MFESLKDAAKGLTRRGKSDNTFPLSCYGKLPIYKDYISLEVGKGAGEAFKEWLDKGFGTDWGESGGQHATLSHPHRILFAPENQKDIAIATIWSSSDEGGLRKFPFAFFVSLPKKTVTQLGDRSITRLTPIWEQLESQYLSLDGIPGITEFYDSFRKSSVNMPMQDDSGDSGDAASQRDAITVRQIGAGLFGENFQAGWANILNRLGDAIAYGRKTAGKGGGMALRLPLAASVDVPLQIEMWLQFVNNNLGGKMNTPTVLFPQGGREENAAFVAIWRELRREDVCLLSDNVSEYEHVEDLAGLPVPAAEGAESELETTAPESEFFKEDCSIASFAKMTLPQEGI